MNITFNISYKTTLGQTLILQEKRTHNGNIAKENRHKMTLLDAEKGNWQITIKYSPPIESVSYRYIIANSDNATEINEGGNYRELNPDNSDNIMVFDIWRSASAPQYAMQSKAIGHTIINYRSKSVQRKSLTVEGIKVVFRISVPRIDNKHTVALTGSNNELGNNNIERAVIMYNPNHPTWEVEVYFNYNTKVIDYKYIIVDKATGRIIFDDNNNCHSIKITSNDKSAKNIYITDEHFNYSSTPWKCAGVAIPVFSLRSNNGCGVGEFIDIKKLTDWAEKTGLKIIQILPVNDTTVSHTWNDSYPYSGISVYALHPIYVNLGMIGRLKSPVSQAIVEEQYQRLNRLDKVDYEAVMRLKSRCFKLLYDQQERSFFNETGYISFFRQNQKWLKPYAAFAYLRDLYNTADFRMWGKYSNYSTALIDELCDPKANHFDDIAIHYFIQYHAHLQLLDAVNYAKQKGVAIKGDIPIGISRNSVDAWVCPELFNLKAQAGAPPDDFTIKGQNWKFPTYNWDRMHKDNYKWWRERLQKMAEYFDAFRIDHILGFFRIWEIPENQVQGILGYFNPSLAYSEYELTEKGICFNYERLCKPYIRRHQLCNIFGEYTNEVIDRFLEEYAHDSFRIKELYNDQRKIEDTLALEPDSDHKEIAKYEFIKQGMFTLIADVVLLEAPDSNGTMFVPRYALQSTTSYRELDAQTQKILDNIYVDYFYHRNEKMWAVNGIEKLSTLKTTTGMLLCGEDLGMVPQCVPEVMAQLGILSLEIQRMPKQSTIRFANPSSYPYLSVASTSSHDTSPLRGWWEEDPSRSQQFYNQIIGNEGNSPFFCETWVVKQIIEQHLHSPSMLAIFPLQDLLALSERLRYENAQNERINNPGNPKHYWRYRMHLYLEDLIDEKQFNCELKNMIDQSGRNKVY